MPTLRLHVPQNLQNPRIPIRLSLNFRFNSRNALRKLSRQFQNHVFQPGPRGLVHRLQGVIWTLLQKFLQFFRNLRRFSSSFRVDFRSIRGPSVGGQDGRHLENELVSKWIRQFRNIKKLRKNYIFQIFQNFSDFSISWFKKIPLIFFNFEITLLKEYSTQIFQFSFFACKNYFISY